jgi:DNA repair exonuclease SbcCD nuclease subunit
MSKTIIITDTHINSKSIPELKKIFKEIFSYKADRLVMLGDYYDSNKPNPEELEFGTAIAKQLKDNYKEVIFLAGNGKHDIYDGISIINYMKYLKINAVGMDYDSVIDNQKIKFSHAMLNESLLEYGSGKYGLKDLKDYDYVFLGHQHNPQSFNAKVHHIGSVRYQNFNEVTDKNKQIAILENGKLSFIPLKSPIPMTEITVASGDYCGEFLGERLKMIRPRSKVRVIFPGFTEFKSSLPTIKEYKHKFNQFKIKLDYQKIDEFKGAMQEVFKKTQPLDKILINAIKQIEDKDVRELIEGVL